ncbi:MAG: glycoside hydrolase family 36 protein [Lachnospiraceae bacterium]
MKQILNIYELGDMAAIYLHDTETQQVGFTMLPMALAGQFTIEGEWQIESLVQLKLVGDNYPNGFSHGHSMRNSQSSLDLKYVGQTVLPAGKQTKIITTVSSDKVAANHVLIYDEAYDTFEISSEITNLTSEVVKVEMLSSFSISAIASLEEKERSGDFEIHRLMSKWSAEGCLESRNALEYQLEPSWQRYGVNSLRYGQVGSMPVRRYFPWGVIEDKKYGFCIGAMLKHAASWQMEFYNRDDRLAFSGGLADREFGHWLKDLKPGEMFITPTAVLSAATGTVDDMSHRLVSQQKKAWSLNAPVWEKEMPILFNEFCTTWGTPSEEKIAEIARILKGKGFTYLVIDCGWYAHPELGWESNMGDWEINPVQFPNGFGRAVEIIRENGMKPGIWFEIETTGKDAKAFHYEDMLCKRDGYPITTGGRRFWDMRKPEVIEYLTEKVIGTIKEYGFEYLKIDYNDNLGIGCDGAESLGEGLRQTIAASQDFIRKIKRECPNLVIENCSSGGHRLEPSMMELVSMASFSDAHECVSIPIIAANVHRAILPEQSQIWAVIRQEDSIKRIVYSMTNTFLGRMCLSGDIENLSQEQWNKIEESVALYKEVSHIIRDGKTYYLSQPVASYNHPKGYQAILRKDAETKEALLILNTFTLGTNQDVVITLPENSEYEMIKQYMSRDYEVEINENKMTVKQVEDFEGMVFHLGEKRNV